ncbi:LysR family substrate-binding domain-containing protein [Labedaea rhizosphaerae]|uniref:LysR substrate binding domain-containing protein n=1 Tax=Labedaea rhizosphaerae TaxID=598644 RepID=A0A4R6SCI6_LABRH|nr:LysR family substrate-binding domain-containing protein [Labedaea rhizosphaerae]TDP96756.1 LysR substrate binding domain-containing protein [Labedaea rhizosphaerae]
MTGPDAAPSFRIAYVPGVTLGKWTRIWRERLPQVELDLIPVAAADAAGLVRDGAADVALLRLPVDRTGLHAIPLYTETTVVVVPKDHLFAAADEVSTADLADEVVLHPVDDTLDWAEPPGRPAVHRPATTAAAVELVAAGVGLLVVPQSLARLHHRKDLTYRPVSGPPESRVALCWLEDDTSDLVEQFIGIVRGRTVNSTRGRPATPAPAKPAPKAAKTAKAAKAAKSAGGRKQQKAGPKRAKPRRRS